MNTYQITYRNADDLGEHTATFEATDIVTAALRAEQEVARLVAERPLRPTKREVIAVELIG